MTDILSKIYDPRDLKGLGIPELENLCKEIRDFTVMNISQTGGHLASSLGVVELTVALHYLFNSPKDKIIWDVGHQCYPHKMLTGRAGDFPLIRSYGGISGFPKTAESPHDHFDVGHASTSLSSGLGFAIARDLSGDDHDVISVIGDGALTGGMALEALNHIGYLQKKLIIILNDNKMSISPNVGALSKYTSRVTKTRLYKEVTEKLDKVAKRAHPKDVKGLRDSLKRAASPNFLFEKLGIDYIGPVDGHDIREILEALGEARKSEGPILIHLKTKKGKGVDFAEKEAVRFHGIGKFDKTNGTTIKCTGCSYTDVFGETISRMAREDKRIVAITAAMCPGTGLTGFAEEFPDRFFDVGIAEQHAVTLAAGLASQGMRPIVAIYSTFLQRAFDQVIHDVALQNLPVIFAIDRAGLVGEDGPTHHGAFDISYLRTIPNLTIAAPKDKNELIQMLFAAQGHDGPVAIRYPRGGNTNEELNFSKEPMKIPSSEVLVEGDECIVVAVGNMVDSAVKATQNLRGVSIINPRFIKPLDEQVINRIKKVGRAVIVEENAVEGGFGSLIAQRLAEEDIKLKLLGLPDSFTTHGKRELLLEEVKLTSKDIKDAVTSILLP